MKRHTKLNSEETNQAVSQTQSSGQTTLEFATPEEMLRHDSLHTPVPPSIGHRLRQSLSGLPRPSRSWWRRFFGS